MVSVSKGKTIINGDTIDVAIDLVTFMGCLNRIKKEDYEAYKIIECALKALIEEETDALDTIKEFAINMTEIFS